MVQGLRRRREMSLPGRSPQARESNVVLIASADPTAAALVGGLVEMLGFAVRFATFKSSDVDLRSSRPRVYMIDCATTSDCNDEVIGRAIMRGVSVVLFGPQPLLREMRELAARHEVELLFTPVDPGPLGDVLDRAVRRSG